MESSVRERTASAGQWTLVAAEIRLGLRNGEYAPGQRLVEEDLARRYSSSRFLVRRALDSLAAESLVDQVPNRGAQLRRVSLGTALELYTVRGALDALVAAEAASRLSATAARRLEDVRAELICAVLHEDMQLFDRLRAECARQLGAISGQAEAHRLAEQTTSRLWWQRRLLLTGSRPPRVAVTDTVALIDAVRTGDAAAARAAVAAHILAVRAALAALAPSAVGALTDPAP